MTAAAGRTRARRERSASESLLSVILGTEAALMFFVAITAMGLKALPMAVALGGGAAAIVVLVAGAAVVRRPWGVWIGWVLQAGILLTGLVLPIMWGIGALFLALWIYCFVKGRQLDRRRAAILAATADTAETGAAAPETTTPDQGES